MQTHDEGVTSSGNNSTLLSMRTWEGGDSSRRSAIDTRATLVMNLRRNMLINRSRTIPPPTSIVKQSCSLPRALNVYNCSSQRQSVNLSQTPVTAFNVRSLFYPVAMWLENVCLLHIYYLRRHIGYAMRGKPAGIREKNVSRGQTRVFLSFFA